MKTLILLSLLFLSACSSLPKVETKLEREQPINAELKFGTRGTDLIVQRKVDMIERLRALQIEVYELEAKTYGSEFGSLGIYGLLKECRMNLAYSEGALRYLEPLERVTDNEPPLTIGFDETEKLVGIAEETLQARIDRFEGYKRTLKGRLVGLEQKLDMCKVERHVAGK